MDAIPPDVAKKLLNRDFANLVKRVQAGGKISRTERAMLQSMVDRGYGRWEVTPSGSQGGRPKRFFILADDIDETGMRRSPVTPGAPAPEVLS